MSLPPTLLGGENLSNMKKVQIGTRKKRLLKLLFTSGFRMHNIDNGLTNVRLNDDNDDEECSYWFSDTLTLRGIFTDGKFADSLRS